MVQFVHPATKDITLAGVLSALADPIRLQIVRGLLQESGCLSCTLSNHFRVLREAGLIQTSKKGVEHQNAVRAADIEARFPGLLMAILACSVEPSAAAVA